MEVGGGHPSADERHAGGFPLRSGRWNRRASPCPEETTRSARDIAGHAQQRKATEHVS